MAQGEQQTLRAARAQCERCGGDLDVMPDPYNSCFAVTCRDERCGHRFRHHIRASAFSLLGVIQAAGVLLIGLLVFQFTRGLGGLIQGVAVGLGVLLGWACIAFLLRLISLSLLQSSIPLSWKAELIAYLAPAPFLRNDSHEQQD